MNVNKKLIYLFFIIAIFVLLFSIIININYIYFFEKIYKLNMNIFKISKEVEFESDKFPFVKVNNVKIKFNKINENKKTNNLITVGIDFGSINSGFSFNIGNDITKINLNKKFPTEIILSKKSQKGMLHSTTSQISMMNYKKSELNNIIYIKSVKNILNSRNNTINDNICFIYPKEIINELNIENTLIEYFGMLKNNIITKIYENYELEKEDRKEDKILWIISIPSTWEEFEKQLLKNTLIKSGMKNNKLLYQSDAASLSMYYDKYVPDKIKKINKIFMLIDAGGYSVDINVNEIIDRKGSIKELINTTSDYLGIYNITEEVIKILESFLGEFYINYIKNEEPGEWLKILRDINKAIENTYCLNGIEVFDIKHKKGIILYKNFKYTIEFDGYSIIIPSDLIGQILLNNINSIIFNIEEVIKELNLNNFKLDNIIITGGLSQNKIFQKQIEDFFIKKNKITVKYLSSYETIISKGLVLYGINNEIIISRKSPITIGIKIKDKIDIFLRKGDEIKNTISNYQYLKPILENQNIIQINIYISNEDILKEDDLEQNFFGRLLLKINKQNSGIILLIIKYDICLNFYAYYYENGREIEIDFQYFK